MRPPGGRRLLKLLSRLKSCKAWDHVDRLTEQGLVVGSWIFSGGDKCENANCWKAAVMRDLPQSITGFVLLTTRMMSVL
jgi:hypothetical protein